MPHMRSATTGLSRRENYYKTLKIQLPTRYIQQTFHCNDQTQQNYEQFNPYSYHKIIKRLLLMTWHSHILYLPQQGVSSYQLHKFDHYHSYRSKCNNCSLISEYGTLLICNTIPAANREHWRRIVAFFSSHFSCSIRNTCITKPVVPFVQSLL